MTNEAKYSQAYKDINHLAFEAMRKAETTSELAEEAGDEQATGDFYDISAAFIDLHQMIEETLQKYEIAEDKETQEESQTDDNKQLLEALGLLNQEEQS